MQLHPSQMTKESIIKDKTSVEAGYVNHSSDLGGETNHGITKATANEWSSLWGKHGWDGDMRTMPIGLAYEIYDMGWWKKMNLDEILSEYPMLADRMFDFAINAGRGNCGKEFQRILNVHNRRGRAYPDLVVDGSIGPSTMSAFRAYLAMPHPGQASKMTMMMFSAQNMHYVRISEAREANEDFTNGWTNRTWRDFQHYAKVLK